jgi:hypothetical protein
MPVMVQFDSRHPLRVFIRAELFAGFGDDRAALLMYDTRHGNREGRLRAECHTVVDGKIMNIQLG